MKRIGTLYSTFCVLLVNTFLLLLVLEACVGQIISTDRAFAQYRERMLDTAYYRDQDWAAGYWSDHIATIDRWIYTPYSLWRTRPRSGEYLNVDDQSRRVVPDANCEAGAQRIYTFGGSTMWGFGVQDTMTIPAYLQQALPQACVVNYAEPAYNSTQTLIRLQALLRAGDVPDVVIFYNGLNDVLASVALGQPDAHFYYGEIAGSVRNSLGSDSATTPLQTLVSRTALYRFVQTAAGQGAQPAAQPPFDPALVDGIVRTHLENVRIARALADEYGFEFYAFVQPALAAVQRPLTEQEQELRGGRSAFSAMFEEVYPRWAMATEVIYLGDLFDAAPPQTPLFIDYNHLTHWGNQQVANAMLEVLNR